MLHDVCDTAVTLADVERQADAEVAGLVRAVAKLSRNTQLQRRTHRRLLAAGRAGQAAAEAFAMQSMILEMVDDPLVSLLAAQ